MSSSSKQAAAASTKKSGSCCGGSSSAAAPSKGSDNIRMSEKNAAGRAGGRSASRRGRSGGPVEAKIILLGDSAVGKSSIALRFCQDRFDEVHDVTIGGAYLQKIISI